MINAAVNILADALEIWQLVSVGIVLLFMAFVVAALYFSRQRDRAIEVWAASNGMTISAERDREFDEKLHAFSCFQKGDSRYARNKMTGMWNGHPVTFFDYHYHTGTKDDSNNHWFSGILIQTELAKKPLRIRPENMLDKTGDFFGLSDINFESAEFSRKFYVNAEDRKWAYDVLHARAMELLLTFPNHWVEFQPGWILVTKGEMLFIKPHRFGIAADLGTQLLNMIPEYVKERG